MAGKLPDTVRLAETRQPQDVVPMSWDFHKNLDDAESLTSVDVTARRGTIVESGGAVSFTPLGDATGAVIKAGSPGIANGKKINSKAVFVFHNGTEDEDYNIEIVATVNANKVFERNIYLKVRDF